MNVLKNFYENIIPEAQNGKINCWFTYNMPFSTFIMENNKLYECKIMSDDLYIPTLMIMVKKYLIRYFVNMLIWQLIFMMIVILMTKS